MKLTLLALVIGVFAIVGCGIADNAEKTRKEVEKSNKSQLELLEKMKRMEAETIRLRELTTDLLNQMKTTNEAVHLQTLTVALHDLFSPENTALLSKPVKMMPFAKTIADEATAHELTQLFHTLITEALIGYDDTDPSLPIDYRVDERNISLRAASAIAAFISKEKMEEIFTEQLDKGGEFQNSTFYLSVCRFDFTNNYLLRPLLAEDRIKNLGLLKEATKYYLSLRALANSKHASSFSMTVGHFSPIYKLDDNGKPVIENGKKVVLDYSEQTLKVDELPKVQALGRTIARRFKEVKSIPGSEEYFKILEAAD